MSFNIYWLDEIELDDSEKSEEIIEQYQSQLLKEFINSKEGKEQLTEDPGLGFWSFQFLNYACNYIGVTLTQVDEIDANEILTDIFPRKISLQSPNDANYVIPELIAFWKFIERTYNLDNAHSILIYLDKIKANYFDIMNDSSKFGMAKSLVSIAQSNGFNIENQEDIDDFINVYNQNTLDNYDTRLSVENNSEALKNYLSHNTQSKKLKAKKKKARKVSKASRQKNKKRK